MHYYKGTTTIIGKLTDNMVFFKYKDFKLLLEFLIKKKCLNLLKYSIAFHMVIYLKRLSSCVHMNNNLIIILLVNVKAVF